MKSRFHTRRVLTRPLHLGLVPILIAAAALLLLALPTVTASASEPNDRPTIVLVHGAWSGPFAWDGVVRVLHEDGYRTATPTLALASLAGDVATVRAALDGIHGKKILVGHSYGGAVISNAAAGRSDVVGLVYSAAYMPDQGETLASVSALFAPTDVLNHLVFSGAPFASPCIIDPAFFPQIFAQDLPANVAAAMNAAQRPTDPGTLFTPSGPVGWHTLPSWYAVSGADRIINPDLERFMATRAGATTIEFPTASHVGGITLHAGRFAGLIEQAAEVTSNNQAEN
jgi:pimeloyl-ACP methyl ester carboxylesterase